MSTGQQPTATTTRSVEPTRSDSQITSAPDPSFLANVSADDYPRAWYHFASERELRRGPIVKEILGQRFVGFLTESGQPGVLSSRCVHMGSDLASGCVVGETLQCSLHHWQFATDGRCSKIPASDSIPEFARQTSFPAVRRQGNVYFFNAPVADHELPFFDGMQTDQLVAAKPFVEFVDCPWYMIGANAVDLQHFAIAHDRELQSRPTVDHPSALAHRTQCHFKVVGNSIADKLTKNFGGAEVRLGVTNWCSSLIFAHSRLRRTETFGMVAVIPITPTRTMAHVTVMARASDSPLLRRALDPIRAAIRRLLIRDFLRSDVHRLSGTRFSPHTLIEIDDQFLEYFQWLASVIRRPAHSHHSH